MQQSKWKLEAQQIIFRILSEEASSLTPKAILAKIDAAYPFGMRANHPYKCWLSERRKALVLLGLN